MCFSGSKVMHSEALTPCVRPQVPVPAVVIPSHTALSTPLPRRKASDDMRSRDRAWDVFKTLACFPITSSNGRADLGPTHVTALDHLKLPASWMVRDTAGQAHGGDGRQVGALESSEFKALQTQELEGGPC